MNQGKDCNALRAKISKMRDDAYDLTQKQDVSNLAIEAILTEKSACGLRQCVLLLLDHLGIKIVAVFYGRILSFDASWSAYINATRNDSSARCSVT